MLVYKAFYEKIAIAPDTFLCLGIEQLTRAGGRLSYVLWQEGSGITKMVIASLTPAEVAQRLAERLRQMGVDPDTI